MIQFQLGQVVGTPASLALMAEQGVDALQLLQRHMEGDFGDLDKEDAARQRRNLQASRKDPERAERMLSVYKLPNGEKVWIITEADRSHTTFLLPSEY